MLRSDSAFRSPWVLGIIGMGLVVMAANGYLIWVAIVGSPGLVAQNYYERGQDYENTMLDRRARDPGWTMELHIPEKVMLNKTTDFRFTLVDKQGKVVNPDGVYIYAYRPSDAKADFEVPMQRLGPGTYHAPVSFPLKGNWDVLAAVKHGEDEYSVSQRVFVKDN